MQTRHTNYIHIFIFCAIGVTTCLINCTNSMFAQEDENASAAFVLAALALSNQTYQINCTTYVGSTQINNPCDTSTFVLNNLGRGTATMSANDIRFYITSVSLIDMSGNAIGASIPEISDWQTGGAALIDLENDTGS